jgi:integrase
VEAAERISKPVKPSTTNVYEGKWRGFCNWCNTRHINPTEASIPQLADFFLSLHEKGLAISTIEGYRTAINKVVQVTQEVDIGQDVHLSNLIANFNRALPKEINGLPKWDLALVLKALTEKPFEPIKKIALKVLTLKTVFLIALATGKRRSEIHALTRESVKWNEDESVCTINTDISFLAKTQVRREQDPDNNMVILRSLPKVKAGTDSLVCPVRALKAYIERTESLREGKKLLFISHKEGFKTDIQANTVSSWIKQTVATAYENASDSNLTFHRVKAHDVRSFAASWALTKHASMEKILKACSWKSSSTFTRFYLKDMTMLKEGMMTIGPILAATHMA